MNPAISNPIKITGRPIINNNAFAIPHVALHAKTMNLIDIFNKRYSAKEFDA